MADHVRKQIRARAVTTLTGLATTGANVFASRVYPVPTANMPALLVDTPGEVREQNSMGTARLLQRNLTLTVTAKVWANDTYNDTADQIAKEVEVALAGDNTLNGLAKYVMLDRVETEFDADGERPVAEVTMFFEVLYYTAHGAPDVAL